MHGTSQMDLKRHEMSGMYEKYYRLISYAAAKYARTTSKVNVEMKDLFQDGCVRMVEYFQSHQDWDDPEVHNTFKKSLFFWIHKSAIRQIKSHQISGRTVLRLGHHTHGTTEVPSIALDAMMACTDIQVLTKMFAQEFVAELGRMLVGWDKRIFDMMVASVDTGESRRDIVKRVLNESGHSSSFVYDHMNRVMDMATRVLKRAS